MWKQIVFSSPSFNLNNKEEILVLDLKQFSFLYLPGKGKEWDRSNLTVLCSRYYFPDGTDMNETEPRETLEHFDSYVL